MGIYNVMKKLILNDNNKYENGNITKDEYVALKEEHQSKLDVFYACGRISKTQYDDLRDLFLRPEED